MRRRRHPWQVAAYGCLAALVLLADQCSKYWAVQNLTQAGVALPPQATLLARLQVFLWRRHPLPNDVITVWPDFWHYRYVENPGAAWGLLAGGASALRTPFFVVVSIFAMGFMISYFRRAGEQQRLLRGALALVFGGALGNFFDRIRLGYVIDFIDWHYYQKATWPTFNVADAAITVGVIVLLLEMFLTPPPTAGHVPEGVA